jgi:ParB/RepB/Spo0J family partition protein
MKSFNEEDLAELVSSIGEHSILEPLVVRQMLKTDPPENELNAGERRLRAAIIVGLQTLPCMVREIGDLVARDGIPYSYQAISGESTVSSRIRSRMAQRRFQRP